jgi:hypothetical protein
MPLSMCRINVNKCESGVHIKRKKCRLTIIVLYPQSAADNNRNVLHEAKLVQIYAIHIMCRHTNVKSM